MWLNLPLNNQFLIIDNGKDSLKYKYRAFPREKGYENCILIIMIALPGVAQLSASLRTRVASSIPSLGYIPGLWAMSLVGDAREATTH